MRIFRRAVLAALLIEACVAAAIVGSSTGRALFRYAPRPIALVVPVDGVRPGSISSSWGEARSGHRRHRGVDIFARRGTPVVAAADGEVVSIATLPLGGRVVWVAGDGATVYYYAHLDRWRAGLTVGENVRAGETLGYVGNTGNAATTSPHLHFGIYPAWRGFRPIDPAPLLRHARTKSRA